MFRFISFYLIKIIVPLTESPCCWKYSLSTGWLSHADCDEAPLVSYTWYSGICFVRSRDIWCWEEGTSRAILRTPRPQQIPLGKPQMPLQMDAKPQLASFVGAQSWKLWILLGVRADWLQLPVTRWANNTDYIVAKNLCRVSQLWMMQLNDVCGLSLIMLWPLVTLCTGKIFSL